MPKKKQVLGGKTKIKSWMKVIERGKKLKIEMNIIKIKQS